MGKNILITGASSGIGEAVAKYLIKVGGYSLLLVARNAEKLQLLKNELGENTKFLVCDLQREEDIGKIFEYCRSNSFLLDGFVYCAGIAGNYPVRSLSANFLLNVMQINCLSFIEMAKFVVNRKFSSEECSIVAMSSLSSLTGYPGTAAYTMSKSAINAAIKVLSKEVLKRRLRVNAIMPGYVKTPMMGSTTESDILKEQPWGYIDPDEVAALIEFLLSDKSKKITGATIPISAGMPF